MFLLIKLEKIGLKKTINFRDEKYSKNFEKEYLLQIQLFQHKMKYKNGMF